MVTGDRMWRMPLFKYYTKQMVKADLADLNNLGKKAREGGSCTAAAFLQVRFGSTLHSCFCLIHIEQSFISILKFLGTIVNKFM